MDIYRKTIKILLTALLATFCCGGAVNAQTAYTMDEVIQLAQQNSISSLLAKHTFLSDYWGYRFYKASMLPILSANAGVGNLNRSIVQLQDPNTGAINFVDNYNLSNNINLSIDQNIGFTGGTLSLYSSLERLDQYSPERRTTYFTQPISLSYVQPIGGYSSIRWDRKTEPLRYELAKIEYIEAMEDVTLNAIDLFFDYLIKLNSLQLKTSNYQNTSQAFDIAKKRYELGTVDKSDLLQLELRMLNDSLDINNASVDCNVANFKLRSYIGISSEQLDIIAPNNVPALTVNYDRVVAMWEKNSSVNVDNRIRLLEVEEEIDKAKAEQGVSISLNAQFGLTQTGDSFTSAYRSPVDQEVVGISLSVPILDWGRSKGRVMMARSLKEVEENTIEQGNIDGRNDIMVRVLEFNGQSNQFYIARRASTIANDRYNIALERFGNGSISVTELNTAQSEKDSATITYITQLRNYWYYYYNLRRISLYDYISETDISAEFDKLIE